MLYKIEFVFLPLCFKPIVGDGISCYMRFVEQNFMKNIQYMWCDQAKWVWSQPNSIFIFLLDCILYTSFAKLPFCQHLHPFDHVLSVQINSSLLGRGVLTLTWYTYMCLPFGVLFCRFWYSDWGGGFHHRWKAPNLHKLGVFWANDGKKQPTSAKSGNFCTKLVYWWVIKGDKIRYSESLNPRWLYHVLSVQIHFSLQKSNMIAWLQPGGEGYSVQRPYGDVVMDSKISLLVFEWPLIKYKIWYMNGSIFQNLHKFEMKLAQI